MKDENSRKEFEQWICDNPYEKSVERLPDDASWPGQYRHYNVQLAWEAWQASRIRYREQQKGGQPND